MEKCNCGRPVRYGFGDLASCNKYSVCPTYDTIEKDLMHTRHNIRNMYDCALVLINNKESSQLYKECVLEIERLAKIGGFNEE